MKCHKTWNIIILIGSIIVGLMGFTILLRMTLFKRKDFKLPIALGKNISGTPIVTDLSSMPHLLIAGTTGSGKSVCINTIIASLLFKHNPDICKFI